MENPPVGPLEDAVRVFPVFVEGFALLGEDGRAARGDRGGGVVLRREDVAARPTHFGAEGEKGFDQNGRLNGHVKRPGNAGALERLRGGVLTADGHETGHFHFGNLNFLTAPVGKTEVRDGGFNVNHSE